MAFYLLPPHNSEWQKLHPSWVQKNRGFLLTFPECYSIFLGGSGHQHFSFLSPPYLLQKKISGECDQKAKSSLPLPNPHLQSRGFTKKVAPWEQRGHDCPHSSLFVGWSFKPGEASWADKGTISTQRLIAKAGMSLTEKCNIISAPRLGVVAQRFLPWGRSRL